MKLTYVFFLLLLPFSVSGQIEHSIAIGYQMPDRKFLDPVTGDNLIPVAFPLTLRYGATIKKNHELGITFGGRAIRDVLLFSPNGQEPAGPFRTFNARIEYRWYILKQESRWKPFVGAGGNLALFNSVLPDGTINTFRYNFFAQAGFRVFVSDRIFLETEIPVPINFGIFGALPQLRQFDLQPTDFIRGFWNTQRSQLWPLLSVGVKL